MNRRSLLMMAGASAVVAARPWEVVHAVESRPERDVVHTIDITGLCRGAPPKLCTLTLERTGAHWRLIERVEHGDLGKSVFVYELGALGAK